MKNTTTLSRQPTQPDGLPVGAADCAEEVLLGSADELHACRIRPSRRSHSACSSASLLRGADRLGLAGPGSSSAIHGGLPVTAGAPASSSGPLSNCGGLGRG